MKKSATILLVFALVCTLCGCGKEEGKDFQTLADAIERNDRWRSWTMDTRITENEQEKTTIREMDALKENTIYMIEQYNSNNEDLTRVEKTTEKDQDIFIVEEENEEEIVTYYVRTEVLKQYDAARSPIKEDLSLLNTKYFDSKRSEKDKKTILSFTLKKEMEGDYSKAAGSKQLIESDTYEFVLNEAKEIESFINEKRYANDLDLKKQVTYSEVGNTTIDFSNIDTTIGKFEAPFDRATMDPKDVQELPIYTFEY
ncbi:hypothetical protein C815_00347 [Firmicutes bacterium M10-2]|nr:hypothetical protein C815_00347 [Firmicutes bacterium M10-2]